VRCPAGAERWKSYSKPSPGAPGPVFRPRGVGQRQRFFDPCIELLSRCVEERFMDERHRAMWSVVAEPEAVVEAIHTAPAWSAAAAPSRRSGERTIARMNTDKQDQEILGFFVFIRVNPCSSWLIYFLRRVVTFAVCTPSLFAWWRDGFGDIRGPWPAGLRCSRGCTGCADPLRWPRRPCRWPLVGDLEEAAAGFPGYLLQNPLPSGRFMVGICCLRPCLPCAHARPAEAAHVIVS